MGPTRVADQYRPYLDAVSRPAVGRAPVNGVLVVEALACRVALDQLIAHGELRVTTGAREE